MDKRNYFLTFLLIGIIQGGILWMDHHPMFFFGDSASYIWTAISGWIPNDRSFVYGYFIRLVSITTESLTSLVIVQVFLASFICLISAYLLIRYFHVRPWIAYTTALLITIEPLQLLYARYVMTETLALFVFVFYVWAVLQYLEDLRIKWLVVMQLLAVVMISIRLAFIPLAWICALAIPVIAIPIIADNARAATKKPFVLSVFHITLSVCLLFTFTTAYKYAHGSLHHKSPAYSYDDGFFAMGYVIPIIEPSDFPDKALGEQVLNKVKFPLKDRRARGPHRWMEGGAVLCLQKLEPDRIKANEISYQTALHAVVSKPLSFLYLGWQTFTDHFDPSYFRMLMKSELGTRRLDDEFLNLIKTRFHYPSDASSALELKSLTGRYFMLLRCWIQGLLFVPLVWIILSAFASDSDQRRKNIIFSIWALIILGAVVFLVERPVPRYLHIMAWLACMAAGVGLNNVLPRHALVFSR